MLTFIGLGLFDESDVSVRGMDVIRSADTVFLEVYTSVLTGASIERLEACYGKKITPLYREDVEIHADKILDAAESGNAVFLTAGDSMIATTHSDLRIRAADRNIQTKIIHGASITTSQTSFTDAYNRMTSRYTSVSHGRVAK